VKANIGRFVAADIYTQARANNPVTRAVLSAGRTWTDSNGNFAPDCNLPDPSAQNLTASGGDICGALNNKDFGKNNPNSITYLPDTLTGFGARSNNWQTSLTLTTTMIGYIATKKITRIKRFPLVLMLEPLHACNLTCTGCGRIREYEDTIKEKLTVEECLQAVDEAGAPIVSLCGGEPMIYPEIGRLVRLKNAILRVRYTKKTQQLVPAERAAWIERLVAAKGE
jgi:hypothetical protein